MNAFAVRRTLRIGRGFTLVELLLTLVLILLLAGAMVINYSSLVRGAQLDEGGEQFESLVRFARAHAANTGCRVRLSFFDESGAQDTPYGRVFLSWEPDAASQPGRFEPLLEAALLLESLGELVEVENVLPLHARAQAAAAPPVADGANVAALDEATALTFQPIQFLPDGSFESAEIILFSRDEDDARRLAVRLIGETGSVQREFLAPPEIAPTAEVSLPVNSRQP
jgi:prepilin-type N-terminal cleavage/methylation domain-containing protein